ncbi:hypothetical protein BDP81DRAFT_450635 [Colletotrichum phormii]|uniref:Uncharacterized protein n=1 Tax=Colletotrichum phormii TaxID=359342 RepID=A0AAJ0EDD7_9PEZI|nr:uncharacterized protein BDP81DRAFT_450635 [Colletotrichum phormii]KAK1635782.1 hypothetical protein BDP81DRAFT_450635 [Colletotrichum phormii]
MFSEYNQLASRNTAQMPITRFTMPRVPKMIEAICPGCFKGFTKIGSMHRHVYEDRCPHPIPQFVAKVKAEHRARVAAAAARSKAREAARASRADPLPAATTPAVRDCPSWAREDSMGRSPGFLQDDCGSHFAQQRDLGMDKTDVEKLPLQQQNDSCPVMIKTEPDLSGFDFKSLITSWDLGIDIKTESQWL